MALKHRKEMTQADGPDATKLRPSDWGSTSTNYSTTPTHQFDGGALGSILYRDTGAADGSNWLASAQGVLAAASAGAVPAYTMSPSLTSVTLATALSASSGGTGQSSYTIGDLLYASSSSALSKLAGVATGNALLSGGVGTAPAWGKVGLATHVSGTLPVGNGGVGIASYTIGDLLYASASDALSKLADVAVGSVLASGGIGVAPAWSASPSLTAILLGNGSAASPAIRASSFTTTGLFWETGPIYSISVDGIKRVGISASTFESTVPLAQTGASNGFLNTLSLLNTSNGNAAVNRFQMGNDASPAIGQFLVYGSQHATLPNYVDLLNAANAPLRLGTNATERWQITGAGHLLALGGYNIGDGAGNSPNNIYAEGSLQLTANSLIEFGTNSSIINPPADGQMNFRISTGAIGIGFDFETDGVLKIRNRAQNADAAITASTITTSGTAFLHVTTGTLANGAAAETGTLTNAPSAGNPSKWIAINDNGTTRYIPAW